jgi:hypothetical protein
MIEAAALCDIAWQRGLRRVLVTHWSYLLIGAMKRRGHLRDLAEYDAGAALRHPLSRIAHQL